MNAFSACHPVIKNSCWFLRLSIFDTTIICHCYYLRTFPPILCTKEKFLNFFSSILRQYFMSREPFDFVLLKGIIFFLFLKPSLNQIFSKESPNWKTSPISGQFPLPNPESRNDEVLVGILITAAISLFTSWAKLEVCQRPKDWASCQDSYYSKGLSLPKMQNCEWLLFKQHQAGL